MNNNNNERKISLSNNLLTKHFNNHHKNNDHRNRASSSSGSSSNSIKVGTNEGNFQQNFLKNKHPNSSPQFTKSIGMSNLGNGAGYSSFSPQDYLNNPMFDSLNASRYRRYWPSSGGSSSDRTITLRPLMSTPKRNVHKRFQLTESCKVLWNVMIFSVFWFYVVFPNIDQTSLNDFLFYSKYLWLLETSQSIKDSQYTQSVIHFLFLITEKRLYELKLYMRILKTSKSANHIKCINVQKVK